MRGAQELFALLARGPVDRLDALNTKWFDDGARHKTGSTTDQPLRTLRYTKETLNGLQLNVNGVFLLFVSNRCCALNFVPCEGRAFRSALNRFEQHQREELTVCEALQPDLAQ